MMFELSRKLQICDIGAAMQAEHPEWHRWVSDGFAEVIGFEPDEQAYAALKNCGEGYSFLPCFIGDGEPGTVHLNDFPETSSLLPSNQELIERFYGLKPLMRTNEVRIVRTHTLDAALDGRQVDFLKIDVQGAADKVLLGGAKTLKNCLMAQIEVEFTPLYQGQALFAEIDIIMRDHGFMLQSMAPFKRLQYMPVPIIKNSLIIESPRSYLGQIGWSDAIYVPDYRRLNILEPEQLMFLAAFMFSRYGALDYALHVMSEADNRYGSDWLSLFSRYVKHREAIPFRMGGHHAKLPLPL